MQTLLKYSRDKTLAKLRSSYKRNNSQYIKEQTKQQHTASDSISTDHVSKTVSGFKRSEFLVYHFYSRMISLGQLSLLLMQLLLKVEKNQQ